MIHSSKQLKLLCLAEMLLRRIANIALNKIINCNFYKISNYIIVFFRLNFFTTIYLKKVCLFMNACVSRNRVQNVCFRYASFYPIEFQLQYSLTVTKKCNSPEIFYSSVSRRIFSKICEKSQKM